MEQHTFELLSNIFICLFDKFLFSLNELRGMESLQRVHRRNLHAIIRNEGTTYGMNIYLYFTGRISNGNSSKL